jgi:hypothetical protein
VLVPAAAAEEDEDKEEGLSLEYEELVDDAV